MVYKKHAIGFCFPENRGASGGKLHLSMCLEASDTLLRDLDVAPERGMYYPRRQNC